MTGPEYFKLEYFKLEYFNHLRFNVSYTGAISTLLPLKQLKSKTAFASSDTRKSIQNQVYKLHSITNMQIYSHKLHFVGLITQKKKAGGGGGPSKNKPRLLYV